MSTKSKIRFNDVVASGSFNDVCNDLIGVEAAAEVEISVGVGGAVTITAKPDQEKIKPEKVRRIFGRLCKVISPTSRDNPIRQIKVLDITEDGGKFHSMYIREIRLLPESLSVRITTDNYGSPFMVDSAELLEYVWFNAPFGKIDQETLKQLKEHYTTPQSEQNTTAEVDQAAHRQKFLEEEEMIRKVLGELSHHLQYNQVLQMVYETMNRTMQSTAGYGMVRSENRNLLGYPDQLNDSRQWLNALLTEVIKLTNKQHQQ